jgi:hypothetical protein
MVKIGWECQQFMSQMSTIDLRRLFIVKCLYTYEEFIRLILLLKLFILVFLGWGF